MILPNELHLVPFFRQSVLVSILPNERLFLEVSSIFLLFLIEFMFDAYPFDTVLGTTIRSFFWEYLSLLIK